MKIKNIILISFAIILSISYSSCRKLVMLDGNQHVMTETRQLIPFTKVINEGEFNVIIVEDTITEAVVEAESNLIPYIRTIVNGNTLIIDSRESINSNIPINIYIRTPEVNSIKLSGSGTITADSLIGDNVEITISGSGNINAHVKAGIVDILTSGSGDMWLTVESQFAYSKISGSGNINLSGNTTDGDFSISGSGNMYSYDFVQNKLNAEIPGSGNMYVNVIDHLKVKISGSGSVYYLGNPSLDISITGSGSVINQ